MVAEPDIVMARVMVIIYGVFVGLVLAERISHVDDAMAELRSRLEAHKARWRLEQDYRRSRLRMAFEVWDTTGQRIDHA